MLSLNKSHAAGTIESCAVTEAVTTLFLLLCKWQELALKWGLIVKDCIRDLVSEVTCYCLP